MPQQYAGYEVDIAGVAAVTGGAILGLANPEAADLIVNRVVIDPIVKSTGAANLLVGIGATATTSATNIIAAGVAGPANTGPIDSLPALGAVKWPAGQYLTITGSATTVGLVGRVYIDYHLAKP